MAHIDSLMKLGQESYNMGHRQKIPGVVSPENQENIIKNVLK